MKFKAVMVQSTLAKRIITLVLSIEAGSSPARKPLNPEVQSKHLFWKIQ